ncbi:MAG: ATP-binding cassette domain-containing protein [Vampirovibrionales bacterium]|nr:ATP-binding cassette domain-containing protein [Vampirovibrionales bacterium]
MTLAVPLAAQALVNTIAAGVFLQPLVVLTVLLFVGMAFAGALRVSQFYIVEVLQQRVFARVALRLAQRLPLVLHQAFTDAYPPELLNRFFDVIKVQKALSKLLMDGPAAVLQILTGLILMGFYSPLLLGFDLFALLFIAFIAFGLGRNGVHTSLDESIQKYRVAGWLQELARCHTSFKIDAHRAYLFNRADSQVMDYLRARRSHFRILLRQVVANYFFQALASAGILGIGGWLVIHRQLTLGQLVASELVILILLAAMDKLVTLFQDWYDLLTAVEKISHVSHLPLERVDGKDLAVEAQGASIVCKDVRFGYLSNHPILKNLNLTIAPGEIVSLVGASGVGKSTLAAIMCGLLEPNGGQVEINGVDVREARLLSLRETVSLVGDSHEIFDGSLEDNIVIGRESVTPQQIRWALSLTGLSSEIAAFSEGMKTPLLSAGWNLSKGQTQRLMMARAIVDRPQLLILDEAFTGIDERAKLAILDGLLKPENRWTVINISHDAEVVMRSHWVAILAEGGIVETGSPVALAQRPESHFASLFPDLAARTARSASL